MAREQMEESRTAQKELGLPDQFKFKPWLYHSLPL